MEDEELLKKILIKETGKEYEILGLISNETGDFIIYTDNNELSNGSINLYVNSILNEDNEVVLGEVEDNEFNEVIKSLKERLSE